MGTRVKDGKQDGGGTVLARLMLLPDPLREFREEVEMKANPSSPTPAAQKPNSSASHALFDPSCHPSSFPDTTPAVSSISSMHCGWVGCYGGHHIPEESSIHDSAPARFSDARFGGRFGECIPPCGFCKENEPRNREMFMSHPLRDPAGRVVCPLLRAFICPTCRATGDNAHTRSYCPLTNQGRRGRSVTSALKSTARMSDGRMRKRGSGT